MDQKTKIEILNELLQSGKEITTDHLYGESMWPLLTERDRITIQYISPDQLKLGDVILYHTNKHIIAHRFLSMRSNIITTRGDTLAHKEKIDLSSYIGTIIAVNKAKIPIKLSRQMIQCSIVVQPSFKYLLKLRKLLRIK